MQISYPSTNGFFPPRFIVAILSDSTFTLGLATKELFIIILISVLFVL